MRTHLKNKQLRGSTTLGELMTLIKEKHNNNPRHITNIIKYEGIAVRIALNSPEAMRQSSLVANGNVIATLLYNVLYGFCTKYGQAQLFFAQKDLRERIKSGKQTFCLVVYSIYYSHSIVYLKSIEILCVFFCVCYVRLVKSFQLNAQSIRLHPK